MTGSNRMLFFCCCCGWGGVCFFVAAKWCVFLPLAHLGSVLLTASPARHKKKQAGWGRAQPHPHLQTQCTAASGALKRPHLGSVFAGRILFETSLRALPGAVPTICRQNACMMDVETWKTSILKYMKKLTQFCDLLDSKPCNA